MKAKNAKGRKEVRKKGVKKGHGGGYGERRGEDERDVVTHGHSDHARAGHGAVLATAETLAIMDHRLGDQAGRAQQALAYGEVLRVGDVEVSLHPAGHRSEEHTSELQSLMRIPSAVFCLKKKRTRTNTMSSL